MFELRAQAPEVFASGIGPSSGAGFGRSISYLEDITGDGVNEILVGADNHTENGRAYLLSGSDRQLLWTQAGETTGSKFGVKASRAGDINADGFDDFLVNDSDFSGPNGVVSRTYLFSGATGQKLACIDAQTPHTPGANELESLGDLNNDGHDDFGISEPYHNTWTGKVVVYSGRSLQPLWEAFGTQTYELFGSSLATVEDINHDGVQDLLVGSPTYSLFPGLDLGRVTMLSGQDGSILWTRDGTSHQAFFGSALAAPVTEPGAPFRFVAVGAPFFGARTGAVYLLDVEDGFVQYTIAGEQVGEGFGSSIASVPNLNSGAPTQLAVGAPYYNKPGNYLNGRVVLCQRNQIIGSIEGENSGDLLGFMTSTWGDGNQDSKEEFLATAVGFLDNIGQDVGKVYAMTTQELVLHGAWFPRAGDYTAQSFLGGIPSTNLQLAVGLATGSTMIPGCANLTLQIDQALIWTNAIVRPDGTGTFIAFVPWQLEYSVLYTQAFDSIHCKSSNLTTNFIQ